MIVNLQKCVKYWDKYIEQKRNQHSIMKGYLSCSSQHFQAHNQKPQISHNRSEQP